MRPKVLELNGLGEGLSVLALCSQVLWCWRSVAKWGLINGDRCGHPGCADEWRACSALVGLSLSLERYWSDQSRTTFGEGMGGPPQRCSLIRNRRCKVAI